MTTPVNVNPEKLACSEGLKEGLMTKLWPQCASIGDTDSRPSMMTLSAYHNTLKSAPPFQSQFKRQRNGTELNTPIHRLKSIGGWVKGLLA